MGYFDIDVCFLPGFWLILFPHELAVDTVRAFAQPAGELVVRAHGCGVDSKLI